MILRKRKYFLLYISVILVLSLCSCASSVLCDADTAPTYSPEFGEKPTVNSDYGSSGIFTTDTGTSLALVTEWTCEQLSDERSVRLRVRVSLRYSGAFSNKETTSNKLTVNGREYYFAVESFDDYPESASPVLLYTHEEKIPRDENEEMGIGISVSYDLDSEYEGYYFDTLVTRGTIVVSDKYSAIPRKASVDVSLIKQYPELPNGCEVTSLTMALKHVGYDINKLELKNTYLPIGDTNFYKYNIGDPASLSSYGCYSGVIVDTAKRYLKDNGGTHSVADLTHYAPQELYYHVSCGRPVIVWVTLRMAQPVNLITWSDDDGVYRWKDPEHCVLLTGYDMNENTVTFADPIYGTTTYDMSVFEERFHQMGEQAVVIE